MPNQLQLPGISILNPVLGRGELIAESYTRPQSGREPQPLRSYDAARERLVPQLDDIIARYNSLDSIYKIDEAVYFEMNLDSKFLAKSYFPGEFILKNNLYISGTRNWTQIKRDNKRFKNPRLARKIFLRSNIETVTRLRNNIMNGNLSKKSIKDFSKIDSFFLSNGADIVSVPDGFSSGPIEMIFHGMSNSEWFECRNKILNIAEESDANIFLDLAIQLYDNDIRFVPAKATTFFLEQLTHFNPIRFVRSGGRIAKPGIEYFNQESMDSFLSNMVPRANSQSLFELGILDGGIEPSTPYLSPWVTNIDATPEAPDPIWLQHGTGVCSAAVFGPLRHNDPESFLAQGKVKSFRIYPAAKTDGGEDFDLYSTLKTIKNVVEDKENRDIKVYVISSGPLYPIWDDEITPFTALLDKLSYEQDILFIVAAGNSGKNLSPFNRIQPPSDIVNGLGVGAYTFDGDGSIVKADYSCVGPGRIGSKIKPDILDFGGDSNAPFYVFSSRNKASILGTSGTSFSAPVVGQKAASLLHGVNDETLLRPQTAKALLIHNASLEGLSRYEAGWGIVKGTAERILSCSRNEMTVLFNGKIPFRNGVNLPLPFPEDELKPCMADIFFTVAYACDIVPMSPDEYTLAGVNLLFCPNIYKFNFYKTENGKDFTKSLDIRDKLSRDNLINSGWSQAKVCKTAPYKSEIELREEGKWETVFSGWKKARTSTLANPFLHIHAMSRGSWGQGPLNIGPREITYAAIITVRVPPKIDLYNRVRTRWPELVPVRIRDRVLI